MTAEHPGTARRATGAEHRRAPLHAVPPGAEPEERGDGLTVRWQPRMVGGEAGRALAAAQGRALSSLLASVGEVEVEEGEEVSP